MKKFPTTTVSKLPFLWQQAIAQNDNRGFNLKTFLMQRLLSRNPFRKHSAFLTDYLILGSNPILNLLKLKSLIYELQHTKDKKKICLITNNAPDYWGYHTFEKDDIWTMLRQDLTFNYKNIEDFFQQEIQSLIIPEHIEVVFINDFNFTVHSIQKDNFVSGYILHLSDIKENNLDIFSYMKNVFKAENNIRSKYYYLFKNFFHKKQTVLDNIGEMSFPEKKTFAKDSNIASHILCTKNIFVSSITDLFTHQHQNDILHIMGEDIEITRFEHWLYQYSFGSANHIANSFNGLEFLALNDFNHIYNMTSLHS